MYDTLGKSFFQIWNSFMIICRQQTWFYRGASAKIYSIQILISKDSKLLKIKYSSMPELAIYKKCLLVSNSNQGSVSNGLSNSDY